MISGKDSEDPTKKEKKKEKKEEVVTAKHENGFTINWNVNCEGNKTVKTQSEVGKHEEKKESVVVSANIDPSTLHSKTRNIV